MRFTSLNIEVHMKLSSNDPLLLVLQVLSSIVYFDTFDTFI